MRKIITGIIGGMIFMKRIKAVIIMVSLICCIAGCRDSYISNKNTSNNEEEYIIQNEEECTTPEKDNNDRKGFVVDSGMSVMYQQNVDGKFVSVREKLLELNEDVNVFGVSMTCMPDESSGWNEFPTRIYVIDNGEIIPFSIDGGEYKLYHDIMCTANKEKGMEIRLERSKLNSESGQLCILALFNPKELPELDIFTFTATQGYEFNYLNPKYSGECINDVEQAGGEYIDIPQEYIEYAHIMDIAPDDLFNEDYSKRSMHYPNDLEVNNLNELYLYMNTGEEVSGCGVIGIICDGELLQFDDGNYFKKFNSYNGEKTFRYNLAEFEEIEDGLHYFQIVYMTFKDMEKGDVRISERYRVNIRGDK